MGITKNLIYDGISLVDYGVGITGEGVYNAPERDVEMIEIPGRNGEYALDRGRFKNVPITYGCGAFGNNQQTFAEKMTELRNQILSRRGYKRLEDEYHPDEYRMALYREGLEVDPVHYSSAGEFDLVFDCKPQRFLKSGEIEQTLGNWGTTQTASGSIATFNGEADTGIKSLVANIDYNADGITDVSITRTGKNLAIIPQDLIANDRTNSGITFHATSKSSWRVSGTATRTTYNIGRWAGNYHFLPKGTYTVTASRSGTISGTVNIYGYDRVNTANRRLVSIARWNTPQTFTLDEDSWYVFYESVSSGATLDGEITIQIEQGSTGTAWESSEGEYITKSLGQTVYGGTLDLISGVLTSTLNADGTEKATPEVIQLTGEQIDTLLGVNNIWADIGEVEVEFGADPNKVVNPTLFESNPLLRADGYGDININDDIISIQQGSVIGKVNIPFEWNKTSVLQNDTYSMGILFNFSDVTNRAIGGDAIYSPSTTVTIVLTPEAPTPQYDYDFLPSQSSSSNNLLKYESYGFPDGLLYLKLKIDPIAFAVGTTETKTDVYDLVYTYENEQESIQGSSSLRFNLSATYTPNSSIRYAIEFTSNEDEYGFITTQDTVNRSSVTVNGNVVLDSTRSAIGNLYIDLDIGEAYQIIDGSYVPINYAVTMPANLPTLKPGPNDITFSNTITDLKITPRWWRI